MKNNLCLIFLLLHHVAFAQQPAEIDLEQIVQEIVLQQEEEVNSEEIYDLLLQFYYDPLDLNQASAQDLQLLLILSPIQINNFLEYRRISGPLISILELQAVPGYNTITIRKLMLFTKVSSDRSDQKITHRILHNKNNYMIARLENNPLAETANNHAGNDYKCLLRYRNSKTKDFSIGLTAEKDKGENLQWNPDKNYFGFDFISWHFTLYNKGKIMCLTTGDYQMQFGQGLVLSSGFSLGKGGETILSAKKSDAGIRPYTSSTEEGYFKGVAATVALGVFRFSPFVSYQKIDGNFREVDSTFTEPTTGYHRTESELSNRKNTDEYVWGGNLSYHNRRQNFQTGITHVYTHYEHAYQQSSQLYNQFDFAGRSNSTTGINFSYTWQNVNLFSEAAISKSGGKGLVSGLIASLSKSVELALLYRNYEKNFHSLYGNAFREPTSNQNEKGWYYGIKIKISPVWTLSSYYDAFSFPWLKYLIDAPSHGYEYLVKINYLPNKITHIYMQFREENKARNEENGTMDITQNSTRRNILLNLEFKCSPHLTFRSRYQLSTVSSNESLGYAVINDLDLKLRRIFFSLRFSVFEAEDFINRQYAYEKDLLYSFSAPFYYGSGTRSYLVARFKLLKKFDLWIKYSLTKYFDEVNTHEESARSEFKTQIRYIF